MPDTTNIQSLPLIQPSQAQKHVTHNEALKILDLIVQMTVESRTLSVAPSSPVLGACHIVGAGATGLWAGQVGSATTFTGIVWEFYPPKTGWTAWVVDEGQAVVYDGAAWVAASEAPAEFPRLGVSATPDATNRLTVSSPATLLNHAGAGHQVKVNKASSSDTASLMFQTGFSGRAEMGTAGTDDFAIKVSADGSSFTEAVKFDRTTGRTVVQEGLRLTPAAGDLAGPVDGEVWYDSTAAKFRARQNGASVDLIGSGGGGGGTVFSDADFTVQDDGDATKQARFQVSGLTTGTTRTYSLPDVDGMLTSAAAGQTITGSWSFSNATNTFGNATGAGTTGLASGATTSGQTKAVNIGTGGLAGSTTSIAIGSSVSGSLGATTFHSPTVAFGATVTAVNLPDVATFFTDNLDPAKKLQFEVSGITTGTTRTVTAPDASGTMVLAAATQTLTNKTINLQSNTVTGTLPAASISMTGGGTAQDYAGFATRAAFVSWASGKTPATGAVIDAAGYTYRYIGTGTAISDLPGWVPQGYAFPDHWGQNVTPGVTNMVGAITSALGYSATVYLSGGTYAVGSTLAWDSATLIGNNDRGTARTRILGLSAQIPIGNAVVAPGRSSTVRGVQIAYDALTGSETEFQRVGLDTRGLNFVLQRGSVIDEVVFENVGTAICDYGEGEFSVTYGTMEIGTHSYRGVDIRGTTRTGSVWLNLYINGGGTYTPEGGFCISGQSAGGFIGQLNIEHGDYSAYPVRLEGLQGLSVNSLHIEGVDCTTPGFGYMGLDSASVTIHSLNVLNTKMTADDTAVVRLGRAGYQVTSVPVLLTSVSATSNLQIGKLHLKGLAAPNGDKYPTYPVGRTGVRNCPGFNVFKRDTSYTDNNWSVEVQDYLWANYNGQTADQPFVEFPDITYTGNIQIRRVGERGGNVVPYENYALNGAFDKWLTTTATVTSGAQEVANKWTLRGSTGSITAERVQDAFGAVGQYDARITVGAAGTGQSWDQDIAFPVEWLGQPLRLTFGMKADVAGRVFEQVTATLFNSGGGVPATVFKQVLPGSNSKLDATTAFKIYVLDFTAVDPASVTTLGTAAVMRLSFQFNGSSATRAPTVTFNGVSLSKTVGAKFNRAPYDRLALTTADVAGLGALATAGSVDLTTQATGVLQAAQEPAHTGDVTNAAGSLALTIAANAVSNTKMATMAAATLKGNVTGSAAAPSDLTAAQVKTMLAISAGDVSGLGALATAGSVNLSTQATGVLQAAQEPAHTGDVTNAAGSLALTIAANAVSNAKLAQVATARIKGRSTAGTGDVEDLTAAQVKTMLAIGAADVTGLGALATAGSVDLTTQATGVLQAAQEPAHTGDVTNAAGSLALTIAANVVGNAKLAQVATARIKGRKTPGTGDVEDLTGTEATALLDNFTSAAKGLAPASGGGTTNFLRADGTWAAPASGGAPGGSTTQMQFNNAGTFAGASEVLVENNQLRLATAGSVVAPAASGVKLVGRADAGRVLPAMLSQDGVVREFQTSLARASMLMWKAVPGSTTVSAFGSAAPSATGTVTSVGISTASMIGYMPRIEYLVTTPATNAVAGFRGTVALVGVGAPAAGMGGFHAVGRWGPAIGVATATHRSFTGMANATSVPTDVEPSNLVNCVGMGWDAADANVQIMHNDGAGSCTKIDLGASFPVPTTDRSALYEVALFSPRGTTQSVDWMVTDAISGATASGTITTNLPSTSTLLAPRGWVSAGGTSSPIGYALSSFFLDYMN